MTAPPARPTAVGGWDVRRTATARTVPQPRDYATSAIPPAPGSHAGATSAGSRMFPAARAAASGSPPVSRAWIDEGAPDRRPATAPAAIPSRKTDLCPLTWGLAEWAVG